MPDDLDPDLLDRYLAGRSLPGDQQLVADWLAADPLRRATLDALRDKLHEQLRDAPPFDVEAMLSRVNARLDGDVSRAPRYVAFGRSSQAGAGRRWRWAAAAAVVLLGSGGILFRHFGGRTAGAPAGAPMTMATGRGERRLVTLSDGTTVLLAPASRLAIYPTYGREQRTVALEEGQALFTVRHDAERPFRVHTPMGVVEDLGTEFGVRAYREDGAEQVLVASGTVLVQANRSAAATAAAVLQHDQMARLSSEGLAVDRHADARAGLGWARGELVFDDAPLEHVVAELSRWYGVDITLGDRPARAQRLTATFRQSTFDDVLDVVAQTLDLRVVRLPTQPGPATLPRVVLRSGQSH